MIKAKSWLKLSDHAVERLFQRADINDVDRLLGSMEENFPVGLFRSLRGTTISYTHKGYTFVIRLYRTCGLLVTVFKKRKDEFQGRVMRTGHSSYKTDKERG